MIDPMKEYELAKRIIGMMGEHARNTFSKDSLVWNVCISSICGQKDIQEEFGTCIPRNVSEYIYRKLLTTIN